MSIPADDPVSPELALVDPVLRERLLRESLAELLLAETEALRRAPLRGELPEPGPRSGGAVADAPAARRPARLRARVPSIAAAALVALFLALPSLAFLPPRQAPELGHEPVPLRQEPVIAWQAEPSADYYLFQLVAGGRVVMSTPLRAPSVTLRASLPERRYAWRVYVGVGPIAADERRGPVAGGTITLG
jgi:hypothetical protein